MQLIDWQPQFDELSNRKEVLSVSKVKLRKLSWLTWQVFWYLLLMLVRSHRNHIHWAIMSLCTLSRIVTTLSDVTLGISVLVHFPNARDWHKSTIATLPTCRTVATFWQLKWTILSCKK